jgi:Tfp pilus assembly protein PilF
VHGTLLLGTWAILGQRLLASAPVLRRVYPALIALNAIAGMAGLLIALRLDVGSFEQRQAFTELMRWTSWPAIAAAGIGFLIAFGRRRHTIALPEAGLLLSLALFALGCTVGASIDGNATTLVPAHYHGTVGAVTLALLLVALRLAGETSPTLALPARLPRLPFIYGAGIIVLVIGLAWSGLSGAPRKAPHEEFALDNAGYLIGMGFAGIGGFVALAAVIAFTGTVLVASLAALPQRTREGRGNRRDVRAAALLATVVAVVIGGLLLGHDGRSSGGARAHVAEKKRKEVDERFRQGVIMLHAKQYDHALTAFHRVLELAPEMPEAYVNAGFALLGKGEYTAAADFFDEATNLRKDQINAYYGLALALDGLGERRAAIEAMRTYLHRAPATDPYRKKGELAIEQWSTALRDTSTR